MKRILFLLFCLIAIMQVMVVRARNMTIKDLAVTVHHYDSLSYVYEARIAHIDSTLSVVSETVKGLENELKIVKKDNNLYLNNVKVLYAGLIFIILILLYNIWNTRKKYTTGIRLQKELLSDLHIVKQNEGVIRELNEGVSFINEKLSSTHAQLKNELSTLVEPLQEQLIEVKNRVNELSLSVVSDGLNNKLSQKQTKVSLTKYNDAVNAFVALNNRLYALKKYRSVVLPCMRLLAGDQSIKVEDARMQIAASSLKTDDKASFSLLLNDISQFVSEYVSVIDRFLKEANEIGCYSFLECIRMPLNEMFDAEKDEHALGEEFADSDRISVVLRLGFYFPQSTTQPYRVKSLVL